MRDDGLSRVGEKGPDYTLTKVEDNVNKDIYRWVGILKVLMLTFSLICLPKHSLVHPCMHVKQEGGRFHVCSTVHQV